jgi:hypothetical protein
VQVDNINCSRTGIDPSAEITVYQTVIQTALSTNTD